MEQLPYRRRRPPLSCIECRRRKIKCDRKDPCTHCTSVRIKCIYKAHSIVPTVRNQTPQSDLSGSTASPSTTDLSLGAESQRSINNIAINGHQRPFATKATQLTVEIENTRNDKSHHSGMGIGDGTQQNPSDPSTHANQLQDVQQSLSPSRTHVTSPNGSSALTLQSKLQDGQISLNKTRVLKWHHWMGSAHEFAVVVSCWSQYTTDSDASLEGDVELAAMAAAIRDLLSKCKIIARIIKISRPSRCLFPKLKLMPPSREVADVMTNSYFRSFESAYRILHIPSFWIEYHQYWTNPEEAQTSLSLKILLVIAIGSSVGEYKESGAEFRNMIQQWIHTAQAWLSGPLEKDRLDVSGIQVYCLTILARQVVSVGGDLLWISIGSLVHRAMQICLHRDPRHLPAETALQAEVRRRLWATILEMIVQTSLDAGMPPRISFEEFDSEPPSNINDEDIDELSQMFEPRPGNVHTDTSYQLILLKSLPIRLKAVQLLNGLRSELSYPDVLSVSSEIANACRSCGEYVENFGQSSVTPFHRNLLDYMLRRFLLPLNLPFAGRARTNPLFSYSLKLGLETVMVMMSPEPDEEYSNLRFVGGSLFKEGLRSCLSAISLGLLAHVESQRLDGSLKRNSPYRDILKQAIRNMMALSLERINRGETNVKGHMFLSMVLAQVEAMETGVPYQLKIAQSAKESLELCHNLLNTKIDHSQLPYSNNLGSASLNGGPPETHGVDLDMDFFLDFEIS